ncbi:conserved unknown protein [Ectocarpus siliculosus]|uniref:Protein rolling stone-like n=1 Tax=Ectocarpus siliculosus TaxID=2880 RepID=D7G733_ECTSI|nr:conserved unknown protein [Ectocarpus siliculosus]|eukprot:CBJ25726.1 conserved unknown protein [Ectocarpus siliculosus]
MATPAQQVEAAKSATGLAIDGTRALFGGTRQQGLRAGTSRFLQQGWFVGWKAVMTIYCIVWAAWWDRGEDLDIRIYLATWTHMLATAYFVISLISSLLCMAYLSREKPAPVEEGKPKRPPPVKGTRSPVPCYFRWLQHISWVLTCISSMVVLSVFWMTIYESDVPVTSVYVSSTILALLMLLDQFLIATEMKFKYAWLGLYFFVVYIFYNVIYYYEHNVEDRVTFEVFDWDERPGRACLWVFLILAFGVPGFTALHVFVYRLRERMYTSYKHNLEVIEEEEPAPKTEKEEKKEAKEKEKEEKKEAKEKEKEKKKEKKEKKDPPPAVVDAPPLLAPAALGAGAAGAAALADGAATPDQGGACGFGGG